VILWLQIKFEKQDENFGLIAEVVRARASNVRLSRSDFRFEDATEEEGFEPRDLSNLTVFKSGGLRLGSALN